MARGKLSATTQEKSSEGDNKKSVVVGDDKSPKGEADYDQMQIYFRLMKSVPLEVKKSDTVKKARTELSEMQGITMVNLKSLSFAGNWLDIKEGKLDDYGISNGSTINVFLDSGFRIKLHVKLSQTGKKMMLDVDMRDTILDVKKRIQNKEEIPVSRQVLIHLGDELDDGKTIASYNIVQDSVIYALFITDECMQINVSLKQNTKILNLKVRRWYTIKDIKNMIESTEGIQTELQKLYNDNVRLEDDTTMADSNVMKGQTLHLITGMQISVRDTTMRIHYLEVHGHYTIQKIFEAIEESAGIHIKQQRLVFAGKVLDLKLTVDDYGIEEGSCIELVGSHF